VGVCGVVVVVVAAAVAVAKGGGEREVVRRMALPSDKARLT
jgi:hypothetical protein